MIINKISEINNLGIFNNFHWKKNCENFKQYNFLYGWNYSGKTTLSRIFKCLEDKKIHPDFPSFQFKLETDTINITERNIGQDFKIRVFNEEFIEENFKWNKEQHEIKPVAMLGKESIELENEVNELNEEKSRIGKEKNESLDRKEKRKNELEKTLTSKASDIRSILGITNSKEFDKSVLEDKINKVGSDYKNYFFTDNQYNSLLKTIRITNNYEIVPEIKIQLKLNDYIDDTKNILNKQVTSQQIIKKLEDNPNLSEWIRKGIDLHENETICQFCGNKLPSDLFDRLNKHFSDDFDKLIKEIDDKKEEIIAHKDYIEKFEVPDKSRFFPDYKDNYEKKKILLKEELDNYSNLLKELLKRLLAKKEKPFELLNFKDIKNNQKIIEIIISDINKIITNNKEKVQNLESEKEHAREKIIQYQVADAIEKIKYFPIKRLINIYENHISELDNKLIEIKNKIKNINQKIKAEAIGAEHINRYLELFFNDDKLQLQLLDNGKYRIHRDGKVAKNLSTGEKNIIALVYFFAHLEEKDFNLREAIVFIDDPVSSLDSNHTFKVYGFLSERLKDCGQVLITTHNFDFFNLLKDLIKNDSDKIPNQKLKKDKENYYLVKKIINSNHTKYSIIEKLPNILLNFKSEYNYLFSILKNFNETNDKSNFEMLYLIPNISRRFLEAYLFMKYPDGGKYNEKCKMFFKDENISDKQSALKLLDEYSHEQSPEHAQKFPDVNEVENSIKFILETLKKKDLEHYNALCRSI